MVDKSVMSEVLLSEKVCLANPLVEISVWFVSKQFKIRMILNKKTQFSPKNIRLGLQMILGSDLGRSHLWARRMEALG